MAHGKDNALALAAFSGSANRDRLDELFSLPTHTSPKWLSSDQIVFLDDSSGVPQVAVANVDSAAVQPLTAYTDRVQSLLASSKSGAVVFGMDEGGNERQQLWRLEPGTGAAHRLTTKDSEINEPGRLSRDGKVLVYRNNGRDVSRFDVLLQRFDGSSAEPERVFESDGQAMPLDVADDGQSLLVKQLRTNLDADLLLVDAFSRDGNVRLLNPRHDEAWISDAQISPDGASYFVLTNEGRDFLSLERRILSDDGRETIAAFDCDVEQFALNEDGTRIAFALNRDGFSELWLSSAAGGDLVRIDGLGAGVVDSIDWSPDGARLAVSWSQPTEPSRIYIVEPGGDSRALPILDRHSRELRELQMPELIRYVSFDGRQIPAYWYRPTTDPPWPVVVDVHGGPESQRRPSFSALTQFLVAEGFAVLAPNVRGSTGYGKAYSHLDDRERRMDAVADLHAAHEWLVAREEVRADAIAVMGQSYGGFMTLAALTEYPDDWVAGVDIVGIANFVSFLERTGPWRRNNRSAEYGWLEHDRELLERISPLSKVDRIQASLLVIHGRNDPRVPLYEAEQIERSLRERGRPVELLIFDDEGHGLAKRQNRIQGYGAAVDFLLSAIPQR